MSIHTQLAHKLAKDDYELVIKEINKWCDQQAKDFSKSHFVLPDPSEAYRQALRHLKFSLINKEEKI